MDRKEIVLLKNDYIKTFESEHGRRVLQDLEKNGFMKTTPFAGETNLTMVNIGAQGLVMHIKTMIEKPVDQLEEMLKSHEKSED